LYKPREAGDATVCFLYIIVEYYGDHMDPATRYEVNGSEELCARSVRATPIYRTSRYYKIWNAELSLAI
jgi:hypothetical protein